MHKNVNYISILIDGSPKILALTTDGQEYFIQIPNITEFPLTFSKCISVLLWELQASTSSGLVRHLNPADRQQLFYVTEAESEPMSQTEWEIISGEKR